MPNYKSEFGLLLKIRAVRADRAERNLAMAEGRRLAAVESHDQALSEREEARMNLRQINESRFPKQAVFVSGNDLKQRANAAWQAEARLQDRILQVSSTKSARDQSEREVLIARDAYSAKQKVVIKTEAIIEELVEEVTTQSDR